MRALLMAMCFEKGALRDNLDRHLQLLEVARGEGCDIAVFPEFSLTGSVDPRTHPKRAIQLDNEAVASIVEGTSVYGSAVLFGIAERIGSAFYITQVYAAGGDVVGVCRKRFLGDDEGGFSVGHESEVFSLGPARFGIVICAEGGSEQAWANAAASGAEVVFFCSAPGLYGRRTDEASWAEGFAWWEGAALGDAARSARQYGLWVGLSTQAGSTEDEDFPGLAALVSPTGEIVARLEDWRPGTLVADIPVDMTAGPR